MKIISKTVCQKLWWFCDGNVMGLYLFSGPAFEFPAHFGDCVSDSEGEALLDSLFCPIENTTGVAKSRNTIKPV